MKQDIYYTVIDNSNAITYFQIAYHLQNQLQTKRLLIKKRQVDDIEKNNNSNLPIAELENEIISFDLTVNFFRMAGFSIIIVTGYVILIPVLRQSR